MEIFAAGIYCAAIQPAAGIFPSGYNSSQRDERVRNQVLYRTLRFEACFSAVSPMKHKLIPYIQT